MTSEFHTDKSVVNREPYNIEKEWAEYKVIEERILARTKGYKDVIRGLQERLDYLETPEGLRNSEDYKAMKLENETLRRRHLDMRIEKGEEKHRADMLEQKVFKLEVENAKMKNSISELAQRMSLFLEHGM
jgi:hypothetical protein